MLKLNHPRPYPNPTPTAFTASPLHSVNYLLACHCRHYYRTWQLGTNSAALDTGRGAGPVAATKPDECAMTTQAMMPKAAEQPPLRTQSVRPPSPLSAQSSFETSTGSFHIGQRVEARWGASVNPKANKRFYPGVIDEVSADWPATILLAVSPSATWQSDPPPTCPLISADTA